MNVKLRLLKTTVEWWGGVVNIVICVSNQTTMLRLYCVVGGAVTKEMSVLESHTCPCCSYIQRLHFLTCVAFLLKLHGVGLSLAKEIVCIISFVGKHDWAW